MGQGVRGAGGRLAGAFVAVCHLVVAQAAPSQVSVTIPRLGEARGTLSHSLWTSRPIYQFQGIPYARPPSGPLRFKPPVEAPPWSGVLNATDFSRECPQAFTSEELKELYQRQMNSSGDVEDCLHLNVYTPKTPGKCNKLLPVMFYIHGGSFRVGSAKTFKPDHLLEYDVLLVTVQYRLGTFGFLSLQNEDISGNMGLLDQILALKWVHKYIDAFCGDKEKVTIFGQSAGGAAVSIMMTSPLAKGLFHRGIIQSGSALCEWAMMSDPVTYATSIALQVGCSNSSKAEIADCLRKATPYKLVEAQSSLIMETMMEESKTGAMKASDVSGSHVIVQNEGPERVLSEDPKVSFNSGQFLKVPLMVGVTKHEGTFIVGDIYDFYDRNISFFENGHHSPDLLKVVLTYAGIEDRSDAVKDVFQKFFFKENEMGNFSAMIPGLADVCPVWFTKQINQI